MGMSVCVCLLMVHASTCFGLLVHYPNHYLYWCGWGQGDFWEITNQKRFQWDSASATFTFLFHVNPRGNCWGSYSRVGYCQTKWLMEVDVEVDVNGSGPFTERDFTYLAPMAQADHWQTALPTRCQHAAPTPKQRNPTRSTNCQGFLYRLHGPPWYLMASRMWISQLHTGAWCKKEW